MKTSRFFSVVAAVAVWCSFCVRGQSSLPKLDPLPKSATGLTLSNEQLDKILVVGASNAVIEKIFGPPLTPNPLPDGLTEAHYVFSPPNYRIEHANFLGGVEVVYSNGVLARWLPIWSSIELGGRYMLDSTKTNGMAVTLSIYVMPGLDSGSIETFDRAFEQHALRPEFVASNAVVRKDVIRVRPQASNDSAEEVSVQLDARDVELFKKFTLHNISKPMVFAVDWKPIATNEVRSPIEDGSLILRDKNGVFSAQP